MTFTLPKIVTVALASSAFVVPTMAQILPIAIKPYDASSCGSNTPYPCNAPDWVFCINAECDRVPTSDPNLYGGKPFVNCNCWNQTIGKDVSPGLPSTFSILPAGTSGANCVLGNMEGGASMCKAMSEGALVSTYGPEASAYMPNELEAATCKPRSPWAWCWGAPCIFDSSATFGITCHCPYMFSDVDVNQQVSLAGKQQCGKFGPINPCQGEIHNSMPAGTAPNDQPPCYVEAGAETCTDCCSTTKKSKKRGKMY